WSLFARGDQADLLGRLQVEPRAPQVLDQAIPPLGRITDPERLEGLLGGPPMRQPAPLELLEGEAAVGVLEEHLLEVARRRGVHVVEHLLPTLLRLEPAPLRLREIVEDLDAEPLRQT